MSFLSLFSFLILNSFDIYIYIYIYIYVCVCVCVCLELDDFFGFGHIHFSFLKKIILVHIVFILYFLKYFYLVVFLLDFT